MDHAFSAHPGVQTQLDRLASLSPGRDVLGLERITALLGRLGNPQDRLPPVFHVAGTNGKGSTCAFLRAAIEASPADLRVGVLASGGLSHFVVEEAIDRQVMDGLAEPDGALLRALPREALLEGSSEILNWVMTAGAVAPLPLAWSAYEPIRRTPAGTGIGCGFAIWQEEAA